MRRFGSDKPDLRFGLEIEECTEYFQETPFRVFQAPYVGAVVMPGGASQPRRTLDGWQDFAKQRGHRGLAYVLVADDGTLGGPVAKNLSDAEREGLAAHVGAKPGDCVFFSAGPAKTSRALLGAVRIEIAKRLDLIDPNAWAFTWVVDPPLFEPTDEATAHGDVAVGSGAWTAVHHAFTSPKPEFEDQIDSDPGAVLADAYDVVCNGNEIGGGSIRIHRRDVQEKVFAVMGLDKAEAEEKFGFLLEAFMFGAPPHGGIAFGWDRINSAAGRHGLDPGGDRVPEVRRWRRPADRCACADHTAAAQGIRNRRQACEASPVMTEIPDADAMKAFNQNIVEEFRANGGKVGGPFDGATLLLLTTTGAKSGQPRLAPLAYLTIDQKMIIIGSKAGADTNPDWVHNLRANPRAHIEVGTEAYDVAARELPPEERDEVFPEDHSRRAGVRRLPGQDQPGHSAVRAAEGLTPNPFRLERRYPGLRRNRTQGRERHQITTLSAIGTAAYSRSTMVALAMPPPSHIVCSP